MIRYLAVFTLLATGATAGQAQRDPVQTQIVLQVDSKAPVIPAAGDIALKVNDRVTPVSSLTPVKPAGAQVALLMMATTGVSLAIVAIGILAVGRAAFAGLRAEPGLSTGAANAMFDQSVSVVIVAT